VDPISPAVLGSAPAEAFRIQKPKPSATGVEREMAAAEAWKTRFRERVLDAHGRLSMVVWKVGNARGSLAAPVRAPATEATRARIRCAERALEDASSDLAAAASLLGSAE
jgi:hypothetical protein